uniref:C2H2-type domain-containing protein n=1 Tax=Globisporangium ultimum (strain ATCC 200006 / CBS 805.95 / DAOM BR144) TaxID=431595 RepID=K3X6A8_GLOUD
MASTVLEQLRAEQEAIESYERAVVSILGEKPRNHRERVLHGHKVSNLLDQVVQHSAHVKELYDDKDKTFEEEIESMRGRAVFTSFYEQLKGIRTFHRKYPNTVVSHEPSLEEALNPQVPFSGEERFGKYVDLHEFYARFLNIPALKWQIVKHSKANRGSSARKSRKGAKTGENEQEPADDDATPHVDYFTYLSCVSDFTAIPVQEKTKSTEYQTYLHDLKHYLLDFYRRTQPLVDLDDVVAETSAKFEKQWALNQVARWDSHKHGVTDGDANGASRDFYCEFCDKQFSSEGTYNGHLNGKKHKKAAAEAAANTKADGETLTKATEAQEKRKALAFDEVLIRRMCELLTEVIHATISYLELKQTRTHDELLAEIAEEEEGSFSDVDVENANPEGDDDEQPFYNPLNLPLGWDGKPIPYWLYKLHGLGVEYKCEICGNHSYWGRRAFDRHFQEWRHAFGMRCLKIPNTKHFHDITLMRDAIQLYEKLKDQIDAENWNPENEEEFEDSEGNVLNRKTYEDLARQGLL